MGSRGGQRLHALPQHWNPERLVSFVGTKPALKCFQGNKEIINQEQVPRPHAAITINLLLCGNIVILCLRDQMSQ